MENCLCYILIPELFGVIPDRFWVESSKRLCPKCLSILICHDGILAIDIIGILLRDLSIVYLDSEGQLSTQDLSWFIDVVFFYVFYWFIILIHWDCIDLQGSNLSSWLVIWYQYDLIWVIQEIGQAHEINKSLSNEFCLRRVPEGIFFEVLLR